MSQPNFLRKEVRERLLKLLAQDYPDISQLYPRKNIQDLTDNELYEIIGEEKTIEEVLGQPEGRSAYQAIRLNFPDYKIDLSSLKPQQLERLARGTELIDKVLEPTQYQALSKERTFANIAKPPTKPAIGNHYSSYHKSSKTPTFKIGSPRRGINPRDERY